MRRTLLNRALDEVDACWTDSILGLNAVAAIRCDKGVDNALKNIGKINSLGCSRQ